MLGWLKNMFSPAAPAPPQPSDPVDYQGYTLIATPRQVSGGWSTEGIIRLGSGEDARETTFIRADTCMSRDDAVQMALAKARKIVDEKGEGIFSGRV